MKKEAMLYEKTAGGAHCYLCAHHCVINDGKWGVCGVRGNSKGRLFTSVYGEVIEANVENYTDASPHRALKNSKTYTIATVGCNFHCRHCSNSAVSQITKRSLDEKMGYEQAPREIVIKALGNGCKSIYFNYTEPTVYFEYMYDIASLAKKSGLKTIMATNGFMTNEAIDVIKPYIDVIKVDLKSFSDDFYVNSCAGRLGPVLDTIRYVRQTGLWQEINTLIVPGLNDSESELQSMAEFIAGVGADIPWHVTRLEQKTSGPASHKAPPESLLMVEKLAKKSGLRVIDSPVNMFPAMA